MKNPVTRTIAFLLLLVFMVMMTFTISGQLFKFTAMVITSFTATEAQEKESNEKIVKYADFMVNNILGSTASSFASCTLYIFSFLFFLFHKFLCYRVKRPPGYQYHRIVKSVPVFRAAVEPVSDKPFIHLPRCSGIVH